MSVEAIGYVWNNSLAELGARLVILALADYADDQGWSYPSVGTLAKKARLSERMARYNLRKLEDMGEIQTEARTGPHGTSRYRIVGLRGGGANIAGGQFATRVGKKIAPEPSLEPSESLQESFIETSPLKTRPTIPTLQVIDYIAESFEAFWKSYPKRNGKKLGRGQAEKRWRDLSAADRELALVTVTNYARACDDGLTFAKDAVRWLDPKKRPFAEWEEPAEPGPERRWKNSQEQAIDEMKEAVYGSSANGRGPGGPRFELPVKSLDG